MTIQDVEKLTRKITKLASRTRAELVGFASAEDMEKGAPTGHKPSDLLKGAKSVLILACGRSLNEDREYTYHWGPSYSLTYIHLKDEVGRRRVHARECIYAVTEFLRREGFKAVTEPHGWSGILSFKMAAYQAGLGVFGKGNFIVNPTHGALNILACIVTDAVLQYGKPMVVDVCRDCVECIKACRYGAYRKAGDRFMWLGDKCRAYDLIMNPVTLKWTYGPCNSKCANVCPAGASDGDRSLGNEK